VGSVDEYQLRLGRQRQVWLNPIADERVGVQVKLWDPLRTRAIPERFCGGASLRRGAISSVCTLPLPSRGHPQPIPRGVTPTCAHKARETATELCMVIKNWVWGKFYRGDHAPCPGQFLVTRMLMRSLFAVANQ